MRWRCWPGTQNINEVTQMKSKTILFLSHAKLVLLAVLKPLGFWGVAALAALDTSSLAIPMDIIVAGYIWADRAHFWVYAVMVGLGSAVGALVPYYIGRAGGELVLLKRMEREKYEQMQQRFTRRGFFTVMVPAALPPPTPFKLFAFGAGVFGMGLPEYLLAVFCGRTLHYLILGILTVRYGPQIVGLVVGAAKQHTGAILLVAALLVVALAGWWMWKRLSRKMAV